MENLKNSPEYCIHTLVMILTALIKEDFLPFISIFFYPSPQGRASFTQIRTCVLGKLVSKDFF